MKILMILKLRFLGVLLPCIMVVSISAQTETEGLSDFEADQIIAEDMAALAARREAMTPSFTVLETVTKRIGKKDVIMRRVLPPRYPEMVASVVSPEALTYQFPSDYSGVKSYERISAAIRIFDETFSEIIWRGGDREITVWSNVNFQYLNAFEEFIQDGVAYALVASVSKASSDEEAQGEAAFASNGHDYHPSMTPTEGDFSGEGPEYLVFQDSEEAIPEALYAQLDALHEYYLGNEKALRESAHRRCALAEARTRYEEANPKTDEPITINFWKVEK